MLDIGLDDVFAEQVRVFHNPPGHGGPNVDGDVVLSLGLSLDYDLVSGNPINNTNAQRAKLRAVDGISFGLGAGECFGLLGPNGAGKTSLLGMMTGEIRPPTVGEGIIQVRGEGGELLTLRIREHFSTIFRFMAMVPQFDTQWCYLTGREHLRLFAKVAGTYNNNNIPPGAMTSGAGAVDGEILITNVLKAVGLRSSEGNQLVRTLSDGMRRKLSLGLAMITAPTVLYLDEPSTGVDAEGRQLLWRMIQRRTRTRQDVTLLTTHHIEEADQLCTKVAIMNRGRLLCIGAPQYLKGLFGSQYVLELHLRRGTAEVCSSVRSVIKRIASQLYGCPCHHDLVDIGDHVLMQPVEEVIMSMATGWVVFIFAYFANPSACPGRTRKSADISSQVVLRDFVQMCESASMQVEKIRITKS